MKGRRIVGAAVGVTLAVAAAACGGSDGGVDAGEATVGVAMPTEAEERWISDGDNLTADLEALGYGVDLRNAHGDVQAQVSQIDDMISDGVDALVIAAVDGTALTAPLERAAEDGIPVIAYDRLIRDSANVDAYATFDNYDIGVQQATSLLYGLRLTDLEGAPAAGAPAGPLSIEIVAGSPDDNNATFFFNGAMDTLQPYLDDGTLVVGSGQSTFGSAATPQWDPATARTRMEGLLTSAYASQRLDGVLSPNDRVSIAILDALAGAGYGTPDRPWPIVTGQDADVASVRSILAGGQFATIFKDTRELARVAAEMVDAVLGGEEPTVNDTVTYDNGVEVVPAYLLGSQIIVRENVRSVLVDGGTWSAEDLGL